jgi:hypothetical protein
MDFIVGLPRTQWDMIPFEITMDPSSSLQTVVAYGFTENRQFGAKTDRNSIFLGRDPHMVDRLSKMVPYMNFYGF